MLVLTDPISSGLAAGRSTASAPASARISTGSPTGVPVPCASTYPTSPACDARSSQSRRDRRFLRFLAGHGDAVGVAVLRHRRAEDLGVDLVAVAQRLRKRFDDDDRAALSARVTVGGLVEGLAAPVGAEESALRFRDGRVGSDHDVHAAGKCEIAFAVPDALRRKVYRDQRTRARRVDRHARPAEVEREARSGSPASSSSCRWRNGS